MPRRKRVSRSRSSKARSSRSRSSRSRSARSSRRGRAARERGMLFEDVVMKYFGDMGFRVRRNVVLRGFSGARHEVDVLIEAADGRRGLVEAKNYSRPVPKEWVMKAYNVAKDLGLTMVYVVSASGFTSGARKIADVLGVELLDIDRMAEVVRLRRSASQLSSGFVRPVFGVDRARELASKFVVKMLFIPVEDVAQVDLVYLPFYLVRGIYEYYAEEGLVFKRAVKRKREALLPIDGLGGRIPLHAGDYVDLIDVADLRDSERALLGLLLGGEGDREALLKETGWSKQKLTRTLKSLMARGLVGAEEEGGKRYYTVLPTIPQLEGLVKDLPKPEDGKPTDGEALTPRIMAASAQAIVRDIYGLEDRGVSLLYLPVYKARLERRGEGGYRHLYLAAWMEGKPVLIRNLE